MIGRVNPLSFQARAIILARTEEDFEEINKAYDKAGIKYSYTSPFSDPENIFHRPEDQNDLYIKRLYGTNTSKGFDANIIEKYNSGKMKKKSFLQIIGKRDVIRNLHAYRILHAINNKDYNFKVMRWREFQNSSEKEGK